MTLQHAIEGARMKQPSSVGEWESINQHDMLKEPGEVEVDLRYPTVKVLV